MSRTLQEAAQMALDALDDPSTFRKTFNARAALRAALAAPEPEPVARVAEVHMSRYTIEWTNGPLPEGTGLYAAPPAAPAPAAPVPDGWVVVPRGLLRRLIAEALTFDPSLQDKEAIEQAKQLAASPAAPPAAPAPVVREPQPEPVQRLMRFAGKKRSEVSNPCLTAREAIVIADWMQAHGITGASK